MKIKDYISKSIQEYPSLFKDIDYENSKLKVLNHIFFVNGNGIKFAKGNDGEELGYLVDPKYKKIKGEWKRMPDKPYGEVKFRPMPSTYFNDVVYYVYNGDKPLDIRVKKSEYDIDALIRYKKTDRFGKPELYLAESTYDFRPYPFSKDYCRASDVFYNDAFLQSDWMEELVVLCKRALAYYSNEEEYVHEHYYPTENRIQEDLKSFQEAYKKGGLKAIGDLRKNWGYENKDDIPDYDEIKEHIEKSWNKFLNGQIDFLNKLIQKYENSND